MRKILSLTILSLLSLSVFAKIDVKYTWEDHGGYYDNKPSTYYGKHIFIKAHVDSKDDCWDIVFEPTDKEGTISDHAYRYQIKEAREEQESMVGWIKNNLPYYHAECYKEHYVDEVNHKYHTIVTKYVVKKIEIK